MKMVLVFSTFVLFFVSMAAIVDSFEFKVGDSYGWVQPNSSDAQIYNQWATRNRFQVGDSLYFEYANDSVLVVEKGGYYHCNTTDPLLTFNNGKTLYNLDRPGFYYFISGIAGHCEKGQRLVVDVMKQPPPANSPPSQQPPAGGGESPSYPEGTSESPSPTTNSSAIKSLFSTVNVITVISSLIIVVFASY